MASSTVASATSLITSIASSATSVPPPSSTSPAPPPASSTSSSDADSGSGRPLLFFVALGFGVVFTNLWIIVGIKYCFRYNRRMRAGMLNDEHGDPIDLTNLPGHRPRRRREKKLMTMDEVNERFPLSRYKMWKSAREQQGLAPEGGVTAPSSRPASIHAARASTEATGSELKKSAITGTKPTTEPMTPLGDSVAAAKDFGSASKSASTPAGAAHDSEKAPVAEHGEHATRTQTTDSDELEDDDRDPIDEPIHPGISGYYPEEAPAGDSCAICIDVLEDDDEIRGLTCGHAFHAGCLDPWLTGRRACCPLCKADYYVPKPRAEGDAGAQAGPLGSSAPSAGRRAVVDPERSGIITMPRFPGRTRRMIFGGPPDPTRVNAASGARQPVYNPRAMRQPGDGMGARALSWFRRIPDNMPFVGMRQNQGEQAATQTTPADLEAGRATAGTRP